MIDFRKLGFFGPPFRAKYKTGCPQMAWDNITMKDLKETGTSLEGLKMELWDGGKLTEAEQILVL